MARMNWDRVRVENKHTQARRDGRSFSKWKNRSPRQEKVVDLLLTYEGKNKFMRSLRGRAKADSQWVPSKAQMEVVLRIVAEERGK